MYNYFTLLDDLQEMLCLFRYLPICTIVFNEKAEIIDINQAASDFLRIRQNDDCISQLRKFEVDDHFYEIINKLKKGEVFSSTKFQFKFFDQRSVCVQLDPSLLFGLKDLFVFQFSEIHS